MIKTIIRSMVLIIGAVFLVWFCIPLLAAGLFNIGNATGIVISVILCIYGIMFKRINAFVRNSLKYTLGKIIFSAAGVVAVVILGFAVAITICMVKASNNRPQGNATVVVLGCRVYGENASLMLSERLDAAYEYLDKHPEVKCIVSGGKGNGEDISEALCMYRYLVEKGIEADRIYMEDRSISTRENIAFSYEIIKENALCESIAIVTNEFHQYRASSVAKTLLKDVYAVNGRTAWWLFPTYYVRELWGTMYEWFL